MVEPIPGAATLATAAHRHNPSSHARTPPTVPALSRGPGRRRVLVPASARAGLDHHLLRRLLADVMGVEQPPGGHALGEDREGALLRRLDGDRPADGEIRRLLAHLASSSVCSAAVLKAARALFQNWST